MSDNGVARLIAKAGLTDQVTKISTQVNTSVPGSIAALVSWQASPSRWSAQIDTAKFGRISLNTNLSGEHNLANLTQVIGLLALIAEEHDKNWDRTEIASAVERFSGVARRLEFLGESSGIKVFEDFAHHPTAIRKVISGIRNTTPDAHLIVAFEPVNATGRRNILLDDFAEALSSADQVWLGKCPIDERIPANERMNTATLASKIGPHALYFNSNEELLSHAVEQLQPGAIILFMSPGSFSGIQHLLVEKLVLLHGKTVDPKESARI